MPRVARPLPAILESVKNDMNSGLSGDVVNQYVRELRRLYDKTDGLKGDIKAYMDGLMFRQKRKLRSAINAALRVSQAFRDAHGGAFETFSQVVPETQFSDFIPETVEDSQQTPPSEAEDVPIEELFERIKDELERSELPVRGKIGLRNASIKSYLSNLKSLYTANSDFNKAADVIREISNRNTRQSRLAAVTGAYRHSPTFRRMITQDTMNDIRKLAEENKHERLEQANVMSDRERANWVTLDQLREAMNSDALSEQEKLMVLFYTHPDFGPKRADYGRVRLVRNTDLPVPESVYPNFLNLDTMELTIRDHKTMATSSFVDEKLPPDIVLKLERSLKNEPRGWLFTKPLERVTFQNNKDFAKWIVAAFKKVFPDKNIGVQMLRKIYATDAQQNLGLPDNMLDMLTSTQRTASQMGHTPIQHLQYRRLGTPSAPERRPAQPRVPTVTRRPRMRPL